MEENINVITDTVTDTTPEVEEKQLQTEIPIRREMMDGVMAYLEENFEDTNVAEVAVNLRVLSNVLAEAVGLVIDEGEFMGQ